MQKNILGTILCGGKSERMGKNKSFLLYNEKTFVEKIFDTMQLVFENIVVSANDIETYNFLNTKVVSDIYKNFGPLAGIHSVFSSFKKDIFVVTCDIPLITTEIIEMILKTNDFKKDIVICSVGGKSQYLCGYYSFHIFEKLDLYLKNGNCSVKNFLVSLNTQTIFLQEKYLNYFSNVNSKDDYKKLTLNLYSNL